MASTLKRRLSILLKPEEKDVKPHKTRHTKIICTLGPASNSVAKIQALLKAGMNVARLNFSHGDHKSHGETLANIRQACKESGLVCGVMLDNKGPEIRSGLLKDGKNIVLDKGQEFNICCLEDATTFQGDKNEICVDYKDLYKVLTVGKKVKIDDGLIVTKVVSIDDKLGKVRVKVTSGGELGQRKGCNLPGTKVNLPALTERDEKDLEWGAKNEVDFIAVSFVRSVSDVLTVRKALAAVGGSNIQIISKIESQDGLDNFDEILEASDAIMVARGDLGVEIPLHKVAIAQKMMIKKCNIAGKSVITATQMLESMLTNPRPTRAEASDVANAVFDGTDCVMLSGETAKGQYPIKAVEFMSSVCVAAEAAIDPDEVFTSLLSQTETLKKTGRVKLQVSEVIASSAVKAAIDLDAPAIIVISRSGSSARHVAKYKPSIPVLVLTPEPQTQRQLNICYGLQPHLVSIETGKDTFAKGVAIGKAKGWWKGSHEIVLVKGIDGVKGTTNSLQVIRSEEE